ncbi:ABC transporter substrate-binding protein [Ornithinimicrobium humiphilum]|uniref:ABC-type nitrate/sulfonate/bicarbonate transport system substrate-binding protein n=1 Tax=Ornithinimicrobium humiphilum TaxID=125288 RepID=A0A543KMD8_9MICO|nr:ABC transporter substrate-binding protein [Ornithinimicrobium humiphilum]TQM96211.1 ABC-type nitrate/sulfonate/bicarbonate transport system substrate-binding protein [Ornithinimicrobium humiphilum]
MSPNTPQSFRRALPVLATATLLVASGCSSSADGEPEGGTIAIANFAGAGITVPDQIADAKGFFEERGITADFVQVTSAGTQLAALTSGSIDVAQNAVSQVMSAQQQGHDVKFFCGGVAKAWNVVMVKADSPIQSVDPENWKEGFKALEGTTFGLDSLGAGQEAYFRALAADARVDMSTIELVAVGTVGEAAATLASGRVDAIFGYPFVQQSEVAAGNARVAVDMVASGHQLPYHTGYFATTTWLEENPELARNFCEAITEADDYVNDEANVDDVVSFLVEDFGLDQAVAEQFAGPDGVTSIFSPELDCTAINLSAEHAEAAGLVETDPQLRCEDMLWDGMDG